MAWTGYRNGRAGCGGALNGYTAPRAKQEWAEGEVVNVGFVKGLEVVKKVRDTFALWQPSTGRFYSFRPHMGLSRCDSLAAALAA